MPKALIIVALFLTSCGYGARPSTAFHCMFGPAWDRCMNGDWRACCDPKEETRRQQRQRREPIRDMPYSHSDALHR